MLRKTVEEIYDLLVEVSYEIGEHPVEYVGYGNCKQFAKYLFDYFKNKPVQKEPIDIKDLLNKIDRIWAYFDVTDAFLDYYYFDIDNENEYLDSDYDLWLTAKFLNSDYCTQAYYEKFLTEMDEYLNYQEEDGED